MIFRRRSWTIGELLAGIAGFLANVIGDLFDGW